MNQRAILKAGLFTLMSGGRWGAPILLKGPPGSSKSSIIEQTGHACGLHVETLFASIRPPEDFSGLPVPADNVLKRLPDRWAQDAAAAGRSLVFIDELNTAAPAVQAALLGVTLNRKVGDLVFPNGVRVMAACNSVEDAAGGHDLAPPLANRFIHLPWEGPAMTDWRDWLLSSGDSADTDTAGNAEALEKHVLENWGPAFAYARGLVSGFISKHPDFLHKQPAAGSPDASAAWPSRRTWEYCARALASARIHGLDDVDTEKLVDGCIGAATATQFAAYRADADFPDPALVLDGKEEWKTDKRLDRTVAFLSACQALVVPESCPNRQERAKAFFTILSKLSEKTPDLVCTPARALILAKLNTLKEAKEVLTKLGPLARTLGPALSGM